MGRNCVDLERIDSMQLVDELSMIYTTCLMAWGMLSSLFCSIPSGGTSLTPHVFYSIPLSRSLPPLFNHRRNPPR